jgi:hypothetical protein
MPTVSAGAAPAVSAAPVLGAAPGQARESSAEGGFLDKPGAFTEGFKQFIARQSDKPKEEALPEEAEMVMKVFRGSVVKQEDRSEYQSL